MNLVFVIVQCLLGSFFLITGPRFIFQPISRLAENKNFSFVVDLPAPLVRFIGVAETLAGVALLASLVTDVLLWSTPLAALGVALLLLCAATFHIRRREYGVLPVNGVLFALALFTAVGRWSWTTL